MLLGSTEEQKQRRRSQTGSWQTHKRQGNGSKANRTDRSMQTNAVDRWSEKVVCVWMCVCVVVCVFVDDTRHTTSCHSSEKENRLYPQGSGVSLEKGQVVLSRNLAASLARGWIGCTACLGLGIFVVAGRGFWGRCRIDCRGCAERDCGCAR